MISNRRRVIKSHSEKIRKATDKSNQIVSTTFVKNGKDLGELSTEK